MQENEVTLRLVEETIVMIEKIAGDITKRIAALEAETGVEILKDYDPDRTDYRHNELASIGGGGLMQFNAHIKTWRAVVNGVEAVSVEGDTLLVERSDGTVDRTPIKKPARRKAA